MGVRGDAGDWATRYRGQSPLLGGAPWWHFLDVALHVGARLSLGDRNLRPGPVMTQLQQQKK